jgi:hypothetical protein
VNFKKVLIVVAVLAVVIVVYKFATRVDRSNPVAVATAFTKAMKKSDTSTASSFYVPSKADAWKEATDDKLSTMKGQATEMMLDHIPDSPAFTPPVTVAGKTMIVSADKSFALEMSQIDGKWYVAKTDWQ